MPSQPFTRVPYAQLPAEPRVPHRFFDTEAHEIDLSSAAFGRIRTHYRTFGSGPNLVLLHGLMTSNYSWRYVLEALGAEYTLIMPDLPGHGDTGQPTDRRYTGPNLATWLIEVVRALGLEGSPIVGNSLGGHVVMRAVLREPELFANVINIHSPGIPEWRLWALRGLDVPFAQRALAWVVRRDPKRWAWRNVHYYDETLKSIEEAEIYGAPLASVQGSRAFARIMADILRPGDVRRFVDELARRRDRGQSFPIPLQLLYARHDPMVPPRFGEALHRLVPDAELVWIDDSSHFPHVDSPERVAPMLLDTLSRWRT
jgi:pimeloyl-ACP methyl ester carboxylesterase